MDDNDEKFYSHDKRYSSEGPLPHYAMDAQRVGRAVLKEDVSKIIFGGKSASVRRPNPVRMTLTAAAELKRIERREK